MIPPALELREVQAGYGRIEVLHGVNLTVPAGAVVALLGPNGAGKSTTLKVICGDVVPNSGCVHVDGTHVNGTSPDEFARAGVCHIPEGRGIFPNLTVAENLRMHTYGGPIPYDQVQALAYESFPRLGERRRQLAGTLSGGEQQMLALARAIVSEPAILLLDEISMGLAPIIVSELYEFVGQLAERGITILLVEQFAQTALSVADFVAVMSQGIITTMGEPSDVADVLADAYLGGAA
jgi:branched-chain amino acid transport system ATP-binding protein